MKKLFQSISLKYYVMLPLILIIVFQSVTFAGIIVASNTSDSLDKNTFQIISNTVTTKGVSLEQRFSAFVNMEDFYNSVTERAEANAAALELSVADYLADAQNRQALLQDVIPIILRSLRRSGATSCFIMLENETHAPQKDAVYLRDFNPSDSPDNNSDLMTEAGPSELLYDHGLTLSSMWTTSLDTEQDCTFYQTAFDGGNQYTDIPAMELGYFSAPVRIHSGDRPCITYTIPLLDEKHRSYGVIGFDITLDYLRKLLPNQDMTLDEYGCYYLGITENFTSAENILVVNDDYYDTLTAGGHVRLSQTNAEFGLYDLKTAGLKTATCACIYPLRIYSANSPYTDEQWILGGLIRSHMLYASSQHLNVTVLGAIGMSLLLSITGTLIITHFFMRPIRLLGGGIPKLMRISKILCVQYTISPSGENSHTPRETPAMSIISAILFPSR